MGFAMLTANLIRAPGGQVAFQCLKTSDKCQIKSLDDISGWFTTKPDKLRESCWTLE